MELKSKRVLRHSCWCSTSTGGRTHGPAHKILPQPRVLWAYARAEEGHIVIHSRKERRYRCKRCGQTFCATKGTPLYRVHKPHELLVTLVTLLAYGCPHQAIVAAFSLDERTVCRWQRESGRQCLRVHEHIIGAGGVLLGQLQADELRIRIVGGVVWLASAISVSSRLWLGSVVRIQRDRHLIRTLVVGVRACGAFQRACCFAPTDSPATLRAGAHKVFSEPLRTGKGGRPRLLLPEGLMVAQALKRYARRQVVGVLRRVVCGTEALRWESGSEPRKALRRHSSTPPTSSGCRLPSVPGLPRWCAKRLRRRDRGRRWRGHVVGRDGLRLLPSASLCEVGRGQGCRAAMDRTNSRSSGGAHLFKGCSLYELLSFAVPPASVPKRRGRRPKWLLEAAHAA